MLIELQIRNFLIIESLDLSFKAGMTVITGETGAGKSILLDALQFVIGGRGDAKLIRTGKKSAEVSAEFTLTEGHPVQMLFSEWGIPIEGESCILRRVVNEEGRSRGYINGQLVSLAQLKSLAGLLLSWVGQYEHQALLRTEAQRDALDRFMQNPKVLDTVASSAKRLSDLKLDLEHILEQARTKQEIHAFKSYRLEILQELDLQQTEWETLHQEQKKLTAGTELLTKLGEILHFLHEDEMSLIAQVKRLEKDASHLAAKFSELESPAGMSREAVVNLEETYHELKSFYDSLELDPQRLQEVEARLAEIYACSRKLQVPVEELFHHREDLQQELSTLADLDEALKTAQGALELEQAAYLIEAEKLTAMRKEAAQKLARKVSDEIKTLGMKEGRFDALCTTDPHRFSPKGQDDIEFRVQLNPGQNASSLKEGASGGELSRIALVIAVLNAKQNSAETLIFDEVDVGVSGAVAEKVGQLLQKLGTEAQVLCITHLSQVALLGNEHIHVSKVFKDGQTFGSAKTLTFSARVEEVARMMSGENITEHARQLALAGLEGQ